MKNSKLISNYNNINHIPSKALAENMKCHDNSCASLRPFDVKINNDLKIKLSQNFDEQKPVKLNKSKRDKIKDEIKIKRQREIDKEYKEKKRPNSSTYQKINNKKEQLKESIEKCRIENDEMDEIKQDDLLISDNNIIKTIKKISNNPERFKYTNQILQGLGELSLKNYNVSYQLSNKDEMITRTQNVQRKTLEKQTYFSEINSKNSLEDNKLHNERQDNIVMINTNCKKTETEKKKLKKYITDKAKEIETEKKFVINHKQDIKDLERKSNYEYKTEEKLAKILIPKDKEKDKIDKNILLKASVTSIEESQNARKILENVLEKVES